MTDDSCPRCAELLTTTQTGRWRCPACNWTGGCDWGSTASKTDGEGLTLKPAVEFEVGQRVWFFDDDELGTGTVAAIHIRDDRGKLAITYDVGMRLNCADTRTITLNESRLSAQPNDFRKIIVRRKKNQIKRLQYEIEDLEKCLAEGGQE